MVAAALACATLLRLAAASLGYEVGLRSEGRYRTLHLPGAALDEAVEVELSPRAALRLAEHSAELALAYEPRFTYADRPGQTTLWYHQGTLSSAWRPDPLWQLTAHVDGARGNLSFLELVSRPAADANLASSQPVPAALSVRFERLQAGAGIAGQLSPRLRTRLSLEQSWEGGSTPEARLLLPWQFGPRGQASLEWLASREDALSGTASGQRAEFSDGPRLWTAQLGAAWRRQLDAESTLRLGASAARSSADSKIRPAADAALQTGTRVRESRLELRLETALAPFVDRLTATASQRVSGSAFLSWTNGREWIAEAAGSGGYTIDSVQRGTTVASGEVRGARRFGELLDVGLAFRGLWQWQVLHQGGTSATSLLRDRAVLLWVRVGARGWLWQ